MTISTYNLFRNTLIAVLGLATLYLGSSFLITESDVIIRVVSKSSEVVKNGTQYYLNTESESLSISISMLAGSVDNLRVFEKVKEGKCYRVDIQGRANAFYPRSITKLSEAECK